MRDIDTLEQLKRLYYIPIVVSLVAVLPINSFEFYMGVRWVLCISFLSTFLLALVDVENLWIPLVGLVGAVIFNPISIWTNPKSWWVVVDLICAASFYGVTKILEEHIVFVKKDNEIIAKRPENYLEELEKHAQQRAALISAKDREILKRRAEHNISEARLKELAKDPMHYQSDSFFTSEERKENQRRMSRNDNWYMLLAFLIIALIAYGWHVYKSR